MSSIQLFVEGVTDQKFLQDVIAEWYGIDLSIGSIGKPGEIISVDGKDAFDSPEKMKKLSPIFQQLAIQGIPTVVIFDADTFSTNQAKLTLHSQKLRFAYFLFPDNQRDGEIETLLEEIICPDNQIVFDCWKAFEDCLSGHKTSSTPSGSFTTPANKTKIYAYIETLVGETDSEKEKIKDRNRDYRNKLHWNLDPAHPSLKPLREFLDPFFSTK
ncbi:DUF3226 domain-containing protein [Spirosoma panaciterrae]|uniref:DUF3226 domain-containing protein n=1 Tax=Spirosoma panaciterrae TaxID=496058 RepID=UPI000360832E|nr:DUF3226 domain-containing protein [Spirosoma panaciterrae]